MGIEIERKFLVDLKKIDLNSLKYRSIKQYYLLNEESRSIRLRISDNDAYLTIKTNKTPIKRNEYEYTIPIQEALTLAADFKDKDHIEKTRYFCDHKDHLWEIDVFHSKNNGLVIAEIELSSEDESFERPEWIKEEVTNDIRYLNANLVKHPFSKW